MNKYIIFRKCLCNLFFIFFFLTFFCSATVRGKNKKGRDCIDSLSFTLQQQHNYFYLEGLNQKLKGNYDVAYDFFSHCLDINKQPIVMYELAMLEVMMNETEQASKKMEQVVAMDSTNYWYAQSLVGLYQQQDMRDEAMNLAERMVGWFPAKLEVLFTLLDLYGQLEDYEKMVVILDRIEDKMGKSEQMSMEKFRLYLQFEDEEKALAEIKALVKEYPSDLRYQVLLGDVFMQLDRKDKAYSIYQKILNEEPGNIMALLSMVTYYDQQGDKEKYESQLDLLLENKQVVPEIKTSILRMIISKGDNVESDSLKIASRFQKAIKADEDEEQIPLFYAQYLLSKKDNEGAKPWLEKVIEINPLNNAARMMLLGVAIQSNDFQKVIEICEPGIIASPETVEFYFYLAIAYNQVKRYEETIEVCKKALGQVDDSTPKVVVSDFYAIMGDVFHQLYQIEESFLAYDSALVYNDKNVSVLNNYAYFLSVEGKKLDQAEEMSFKAIKSEPKNATFLDTYAWILFQKGNYVEAKIYIEDALKNGGDKSDIIVEHSGDIYYFNGEKEKAKEFWVKAQELGSESKTLEKKIKRGKYYEK